MAKIKNRIRAVASAAFLGAALAAAPFFLSIRPVVAADAIVKIDNFTFDPPRLTVKAGTSVTWYNEDDIPHTVVASGKSFRSKTLDTDDKYTFTFMTPGAYEYFCSLHPHMTGTIVVEAASGAAQ
jgi:plastocyanin